MEAGAKKKLKKEGARGRFGGGRLGRRVNERRETDKQRGKEGEMERRSERGRERNSATSDSLARLGQAQHTSPVTGDWGRHVSSQIAPQTHWQGLSAERGERLSLACSHARVNHWQLQRGGAIKRPWWRGTGVCGLRYSGVISHWDSNQPFLKCCDSQGRFFMHYGDAALELPQCACERMGVVGLRGRGFRGDEALKWRGPQKTHGVTSTWCQIMSEGRGPRNSESERWVWGSDDGEEVQMDDV